MMTEPLRVLLAEDEPTSQKVVRLLLERIGCTVSCAWDGHQALELFGQGDFDFVIMDLFMPRMDGDEVIRLIRNSPEFREKADIPIFGLTAYDIRADADRFKDVQVDEWIMKPVELDDLARMAREVGMRQLSASRSA